MDMFQLFCTWLLAALGPNISNEVLDPASEAVVGEWSTKGEVGVLRSKDPARSCVIYNTRLADGQKVRITVEKI